MKKAFLVAFFFIFFSLLTGCSSLREKGSGTGDVVDLSSGYATYLGKPTIMIWGSMSCPHCRNAMPVFEKEIYNVYSGEINVLLNNVGDMAFATDIPQTGRAFTFEQFTQKTCDYIPTWVVLDKDGRQVIASCGAEKTLDDMKKTLQSMIAQ